MSRILAYFLPVIAWALVITMLTRLNYRGRWPFYLAAIVTLSCAGWLSYATVPNYLWVILFASVLLAIGVVVLMVVRDYDFLITTYLHWFGRMWFLATTIWWLAAIILTL